MTTAGKLIPLPLVRNSVLCSLTLVLISAIQCAASEPVLRAGAAKRDITPKEPVPMWGYGERHAELSRGTLDPLQAAVVVIQAGNQKLAIVGLDLGRSPSESSLQRIRERIRSEAGIEHSFIAGSHTHHGPVLELNDEKGKGKGRFDAAIRYYQWMEDSIVEAILEADNREIILGALTQLAVEYVGTAVDREIKGKEESHARWAHAANELGTLLICAHYNLEDERGE